MKFIYSLQSEWLKTKRSSASWLCLLGGFFLPLMFLIGFLKDQTSINANGNGANIWIKYFFQIWRFMAIALLPVGIILSSSLITQMEFRNNAWKQLHTTPQNFFTIFLAKFSAILLLTLKFFLFFNIGILVSGIIPSLLFDHHLPRSPFPLAYLLRANSNIFITCLPVMAAQYLISLEFKNFLVPVGAGILALVGSLILIRTWTYSYLSPYSYAPLLFLGDKSKLAHINIFLLSEIYFIVLMSLSYYLYRIKKIRG